MKSSRQILLLVGTMCLAQVLGMTGYNLWPALISDFILRWDLTSRAAGWIGGIFYLGYLAAIWPLSNITDRIDPKKIYSYSMALTIVSPLGFALTAEGFWTAMFWRFLQGVGLAGTYMPGLKLLTDIVPKSAQSRTVAWYTSFFYVGAALSLSYGTNLNAFLDWREVWLFAAVGPFIALLFVWLMIPSVKIKFEGKSNWGLLDLRSILANRKVIGFTLAYSAHTAELIGFYTWIVAFLTFSQAGINSEDLTSFLAVGTIASTVTLLAVPASIFGNEAARRFGRLKVLRIVMFGSAVVATILGFSSTLPYPLVLLIIVIYGVFVAADSAVITAGVVDAADPANRGKVMAFYSLIGFLGGSIGPVTFGYMLDIGGGETTDLGWRLGFFSLAFLVCLGPIATYFSHRRV